jgi:uncharacterized membrane protein YtjA (UPF0391 family)
MARRMALVAPVTACRSLAGGGSDSKSEPMPLAAGSLLAIAAMAALFGCGGIAQGSGNIAQALRFVFLVVFAVIGILGVTVFRTVTCRGRDPGTSSSVKPRPCNPSPG